MLIILEFSYTHPDVLDESKLGLNKGKVKMEFTWKTFRNKLDYSYCLN